MKHIKEIEVKGLWKRRDLKWSLGPGVNILAGGNGSGKSTVLGCVADMFSDGILSAIHKPLVEEVIVTFEDGDVVTSMEPFDTSIYHMDIISTFDMAISRKNAYQNSGNGQKIDTELDWELFKLEKQYLSYQLEIGRMVIDALTKGESKENIEQITIHKQIYFNTIDALFLHTGKKIDRTKDNLSFVIDDKLHIAPWQLSSGEKQILIILTTALVQNNRSAVMIMDEPEISLHFDWQKRLFEDVMRLNPNLQLIVATHSPALVMGGWIDRVTQIDRISCERDMSNACEVKK